MNWIGISAINLAVAVALGAFGAHGLKSIASAEQLAWWHTGTLYLFFHALGLLAIGIILNLSLFSQAKYQPQTAAWLIQIGIIIFSGTLFAMALNAPKWLGAITPIGGTLMILGWLWLAFVAFQASSKI